MPTRRATMKYPRCLRISLLMASVSLFVVGLVSAQGVDTPPLSAGDGNRLSHLDEPNNPWQSHNGSAKLVTPQWIGEDGVEAVVVLAIDDLRGDGQHFRNYLTPIIDRLQKIDGRGPVSITCNQPDPAHPNMQWFLDQGVSLETHTLTHPCPLLQRRNFKRASADYHGCVDLLAKIPNNHSVAFRFGCMDSMNAPSPRAYAELLNGVSDEGRFMSMSTSVGIVFTKDDAELPRSIFAAEAGGADRFARYMRPGYVNYVENYPYPFVVGKLIWELPFVLPDDYLGSALHGNQNPITTADFKATVDAAVAKRGAIAFCFHAGSWIRNDQMVDIVDHVDRKHGAKVKFLNMSEMHVRMTKNMLGGHPLRDAKGKDNGVRVFDIDGDGYMDVLIGNSEAKLSRLWEPEKGGWRETPFPVEVTPGLRFGVLDESGRTVAINSDENGFKAWRFDGGRWITDARLVAGLDGVSTQKKGMDSGLRLHDINGDGICELIVANDERSEVYERKADRWHKRPFGLPKGTAIVTADGGDAGLRFADIDDDGSEDIIFSDAARYGTWMFESMKTGWSRPGIGGQRTNAGVGNQHPLDLKVLPPIVRADGANNGAWVKRGHVYWQNEDTGAIMAHHIDKRSFTDLMGEEVNKARSGGASLKAINGKMVTSATDGSLTLPATKAKIIGNEIRLMKNGVIGWWTHRQDRAEWQIKPTRAGEYRVELDWSCDDKSAGNNFRIQVGDSNLSGTVPGTGNWEHYQSKAFGTIRLKGTEQKLTFAAAGELKGLALIDLRTIRLIPLPSEEVPCCGSPK